MCFDNVWSKSRANNLHRIHGTKCTLSNETPDHFENCGHNTYVNYSSNESEVVKSNRNKNSQAQHTIFIFMFIFFSLFFPWLKYSSILWNFCFFKNKIAEHLLFTYYDWIKWWWWHLRVSQTFHESISKSLFGDSKTGRTICSCWCFH